MKKINYNTWPVGKLPKKAQRPELDDVRRAGYEWRDPRDVVDIFEKKIAAYAGSEYAITVDSCSSGLFLALKYLEASGQITIPSRTYVSVPMQILHAGCSVKFEDIEWEGIYQLNPYPVYDGAVRFTKEMYVGDNALHILSFQIKKRLPIGRGGAILTDDERAYKWLLKARHDGRELDVDYPDDEFEMVGWHMYMPPEDAARGILLMDELPEVNSDTGGSNNYSDLSEKEIFKNG